MTARRRTRPRLDPVTLDRAVGAVLGSAVGDALGAGYEFARPPGPGTLARMKPGTLTGRPAGSWTDDTDLAVCVLAAAAGIPAGRGADLDAASGPADLAAPDVLEAVAANMAEWYASGPPDVGGTTRVALAATLDAPAGTVAAAAIDAAAHHARNARAAGNGSLMRTGPVALAYLHVERGPGLDLALARAARAVSDLTHADPDAADACVLWTVAIDRAVRDGRIDGVDDGLSLLSADRRELWRARIEAARTRPPGEFNPNGWVVDAFCAAYAAVWQTPVPAAPWQARHLVEVLHAAIRIGDDTDTVAAIAGALAGARWGASALPSKWKRGLGGWPEDVDADDLVRLAVTAAGGADPTGWPLAKDPRTRHDGLFTEPAFTVTLPGDDGVTLGNVAALDALAERGVDVDAVVSLCRIGRAQRRDAHVQVWLVDDDRPGVTPNVEMVIADAACAVRDLRAAGRRVFLHCVAGASRTPTVAAAYLMARDGLSAAAALDRVRRALPGWRANPVLVAALDVLDADRSWV